MDLASITLLFRVPNLAKSLGGYLGLVESIDKKLDKLLQSDFNAAIRCLRESLVATRQQDFLLHEAWRRFHTALANETGERKALAYVGLALCQDRLGENELATETLRELSEYSYFDFVTREQRAFTATGLAAAAIGSGGVLLFALPLLAGRGRLLPECMDILTPALAVRSITEAARELVEARTGRA